MYEQIWETLGNTIVDLSFWIGFVAVGYFAIARFNETATDVQELDPPITVRSFTTRFRYYFASCTYAGLYCLAYGGLVLLGAFPAVQDVLQVWFGTIVSLESHEIGTPIWAALLLTSVVPSFPVARGWDNWVRHGLQNVASIPLKARFIADHLITDIARLTDDTAHELETVLQSEESRGECYERLRAMIDTLQKSPRLRRAKAYQDFFTRNRELLDAIDQKLRLMLDNGGGDREGLVANEFAHQLRRMARLLVCGMLSVEREEYAVRQALINELKTASFDTMPWRFKVTQIPLAVVAIVVTGLIAAFISADFIASEFRSEQKSQLFWIYFSAFAFIILVAVPAFVLPFAFVTGMRMYLIDQRLFGTWFEWDDLLLIYAFAALGALSFALLPTVVLGVIAFGTLNETPEARWIVPWALPPWIVALVYFLVSEVRLPVSKVVRFLADFGIHALAAAVLAWIAVQFATSGAPLILENLPPVPPEYLSPLALTASGMLGGILGAIQCTVSRQN